MLIGLIIACEIGFWIVLLSGLLVRYYFRQAKASTILLLCVPLLDIILLVAAGVDLYKGAVADFSHGLAAAYLGFTLAFGPSVIQWADQRFAYKFANGPQPWRPPTEGRALTLYEWKQWRKGLVACSIASAILFGGILLVDDPEKSKELAEWIPSLGGLLIVWLFCWPLWYTVFPKK
ncbi:MAG: hypothetical protein K0Q67_2398 [Cellvibrio sp.]|nr:hypothetical protein [Cellvibrio sp.]